jgi:hypothetical protein
MPRKLQYRDIPEMVARIVWKGFTVIPPVAILVQIKKAVEMRKKKIIMMNTLIDEAKKGNPQAQFLLMMFQRSMSMRQECRCGCEQCNSEDNTLRDEY